MEAFHKNTIQPYQIAAIIFERDAIYKQISDNE